MASLEFRGEESPFNNLPSPLNEGEKCPQKLIRGSLLWWVSGALTGL